MAIWRNLGVTVVFIGCVGAAQAQTYSLTETPQAGQCFRLQLEMKLTGEIKVSKDGKRIPLKLEAAAAHEFAERVLNVSSTGLPDKMARAYEKASASFILD